jgi:hypothetical protein
VTLAFGRARVTTGGVWPAVQPSMRAGTETVLSVPACEVNVAFSCGGAPWQRLRDAASSPASPP